MMRPNYGTSERGYKLQKVVKYWAQESKLILLEPKKIREILKTVGNSLVLPSGFVDPPTLLPASVSRTVINRSEARLSEDLLEFYRKFYLERKETKWTFN